MRTDECGRCLRYRGELRCDAFPRNIPEVILTGQKSHTVSYEGDQGILFSPIPNELMKSVKKQEGIGLIEHVNDVVEREDVAYQRVKAILKKKGYYASDFEEGGVFYGWSVNELLDLIRSKS